MRSPQKVDESGGGLCDHRLTNIVAKSREERNHVSAILSVTSIEGEVIIYPMNAFFGPGDVVRCGNSPLEMTVCRVENGSQVHCVWFPEPAYFAGTAERSCFDARLLMLAWKDDRKCVSNVPGETVQLHSDGPIMVRGVERHGEVSCAWFSGGGLHIDTFPTFALYRLRQSCGRNNWATRGDPVQLRCGGPVMVVVGTEGSKVICSVPSHGIESFDSEMLVLDQFESEKRTSCELIEFAMNRGVDLKGLCSHQAFSVDGRFIIWWRRTTGGALCYQMQGWIDMRFPAVGIRWESGTVDDIGEALELTKAWLLEGVVLEQLPSRTVTSWYGPRQSPSPNGGAS